MNKINTSNKISLLPYQKLILSSGLEGPYNEIVVDLLDIATNIYIADVSTLAKSNGSPRDINILLPVTNLTIWNKQKSLIQSILKYLSNDNWDISFREVSSKMLSSYQTTISSKTYESVTLLSGGLDSFCGAYLNINNNINSLYCGYKINTFEAGRQSILYEILRKNYSIDTVLFDKIPLKKVEHTQRTRSFLFLSLAVFCAKVYNIKKVSLYENGVLSLNPELLSRQTTKTTHPKTIYLINCLLRELNLDIIIEHPFLFKTKGEIINYLSDEFKNYIRFTHTCGAARLNRNIQQKDKHCGTCIPCILRKISVTAYDNEQYDVSYNVPYGAKISTAGKLSADYKSSNEYFMTLNDKIKDGTILRYLNLNKKYYHDDVNYIELTYNLFNRFSKELDMYFRKYPIV